MLEVTEFPGSCAGTIIHNVGKYAPDDRDPLTDEQILARLSELDKTIGKRAFNIIVVNARQRRWWKQHLYRMGWRRAGRGYNGTHGSTVYVYIKFYRSEMCNDPFDPLTNSGLKADDQSS